jgi:E3 ubiquitin-protein ligase RNF14
MLTTVQERLHTFWDEEKEFGAGVLWRWWEWIGGGVFLEDLGLLQHGQLTLPTPQLLPPSSFHLLLKSHNAATMRDDFESTAFACEICFETPKGRKVRIVVATAY